MKRLHFVAPLLLLLAPALAGGLQAQEDSIAQIEQEAEELRPNGKGGDPDKLGALVDRCLELAAKHKGKDEAFEACVLALRIASGVDEDKKIATLKEAMNGLRSGFLQSPRMGEVVLGPLARLWQDLDLEVGEQVTMLEKSTTQDTVRCACIYARTAHELGETPSLKERKAAAAKYGELITKYGGVDLPGSKSRKWREFLQGEIEGITLYAVGGVPPDVAGVDLDGQPMKLSEFRGKVLLVDFWAFFSQTSIDFLEHERELVEKLKEQPFALVGVNHDDDLATARAEELAAANLTWRSFAKGQGGKEGKEPTIAERWRVKAWPTIFLLDAQGKIRRKWLGAPDHRELDHEIDELLGEITGRTAQPLKPGAPPPTTPPKKDG